MQIEQKKPRKIRHVLLTSLFRRFHSQCDVVTEEEFHGGDECRSHTVVMDAEATAVVRAPCTRA